MLYDGFEKYEIFKSIKKRFSRDVAMKFESAAWQFLDDELHALEQNVRENERLRIYHELKNAFKDDDRFPMPLVKTIVFKSIES